MKRYLPFIIIAGVLLLAVGGGALLFRSAPPATTQPSTSGDTTANALPGAQPPHIRGTPNASVTLEEFGDFQCPPCGRLHPLLQKIEADYHDRLRVVFRHYPLTRIHKHALTAAHAAEAAGMQGRFWEMHDLLYEKQAKWTDAPDARSLFIDYARSLGLDINRFTRDMDSTQVSMRIIQDQRRAETMRVSATPTVFINNRELPPESMTIDGIHAAIDAALGSKRQ